MTLEAIKHIDEDIPGFWQELQKTMERKKISRPKVVIHGGYGKNNMGDDALFHAIYTRVMKAFPAAEVTAVCHGPENLKKWYPHIRTCHFKSSTTVKAILGSNLYIIGGGGIVNVINAYSGRMSFKIFDMKGKFMFLAALAARFTGAITVFYGVGATSFPDPVVKLLTRISLNRANYISVRDPMSRKNLQEAGVKKEMALVHDPALSLEMDHTGEFAKILARYSLEPKETRKRKLIGLNLRYVGAPDVDNDQSISQAVELVRHLVTDKDVDVLFLSISQHPDKELEDDLKFGLKVKELLASEPAGAHYHVLDLYPHPQTFMTLLGQMDAMILSRLHSVILGTKLGVPIVTISYDNKVTQFVKLTEQDRFLLHLKDFTATKAYELFNGLTESLNQWDS